MPPYFVIAVWGGLHLAAAVLAAWRGGWPERAGIAAAIAAWIASVLFIDNQDWMRPQYAVLVVDILFFGALGFIGLGSKRLWALAAAGFQFGAVLLHLTFAVAHYTVSSKGYLAAEFVVSLLVFAAIFVGVVRAALVRRAPDPQGSRA
jgi:hypothetical protein